MAKKYENLENITELLGAGKLKTASERLLSSEKELSEILKNSPRWKKKKRARRPKPQKKRRKKNG